MFGQRPECMRSLYRLLPLALVAVVVTGIGLGTVTAEAATYRITFTATWSEESHPEGFPSNPHFSGLIGGTHNGEVSFWDVGELASPGIKAMAETGSQTPLDEEVEEAIAAGSAEFVVRGGGTDSPGVTNLSFEISSDFSLITLVSMVAPSPDWFVGVSGLDLWDGDAWVEEAVVTLWPYDAGTDSGANYGSPNQPTEPPEPIALIVDPPLGNGVPLGTFTFTLESGQTAVPQALDFALHNAPNPFNPRTTIRFSLAREQQVKVSVFDLAGKRMAELFNGVMPAGEHPVQWNGKDASGHDVSSGTYLIYMESENRVYSSKMMLVR